MFNRNPTAETTVAYPWAKVFFGFVGGMLLFNFVAHLLGSIKLAGAAITTTASNGQNVFISLVGVVVFISCIAWQYCYRIVFGLAKCKAQSARRNASSKIHAGTEYHLCRIQYYLFGFLG